MGFFYLLFIFSYLSLLWSMKGHWQRGKTGARPAGFSGKTTVLIPFRNEAEHLPGLLIRLGDIFPRPQEVVFIDDGSRDGSAALVAAFIREKQQHRWQLLENAGVGKKAALTTAMKHTQAQIILTTDADCILPDHWVDHMIQAFSNPETQLVAGPVMTVTRAGFFARFQQIEWASILLLTKYLFSRGRPLMCSGANLAYRKSAFGAVGGYVGNDMYLSGDDEFLLKKIVHRYGVHSVAYLQDKEALVKTQPLSNWDAFIQQRARWAGKWRLHRSFGHAFSAALAFLLAVIELSTVGLLLGPMGLKLMFPLFWALKIGVEREVLGRVLADYGLSNPYFYYVGASLLHPVYVVLVGFRAIWGKYSWKGRNHNHKF